jgi:hypothetical protein
MPRSKEGTTTQMQLDLGQEDGAGNQLEERSALQLQCALHGINLLSSLRSDLCAPACHLPVLADNPPAKLQLTRA